MRELLCPRSCALGVSKMQDQFVLSMKVSVQYLVQVAFIALITLSLRKLNNLKTNKKVQICLNLVQFLKARITFQLLILQRDVFMQKCSLKHLNQDPIHPRHPLHNLRLTQIMLMSITWEMKTMSWLSLSAPSWRKRSKKNQSKWVLKRSLSLRKSQPLEFVEILSGVWNAPASLLIKTGASMTRTFV